MKPRPESTRLERLEAEIKRGRAKLAAMGIDEFDSVDAILDRNIIGLMKGVYASLLRPRQ
jgi:hypothetical protein